MRTLNKFEIKYGRFEIRAKMPLGDWLLGCLELVGDKINIIISVRGNRKLLNGTEDIGSNRVEAYVNMLGHIERFSLNNPTGWNGQFHSYQIIWNLGMLLCFFNI